MNPEQAAAAPVQNTKLESWAAGILTVLVFLLPIAFIPSPFLQQSAIKGYLAVFGILAAAILYVVSRFQAKSFEWIRHPLSDVGAVFVIVLLASSVWSGDFARSFFGQGFEYSTAAFLILMVISARLSALLSSKNPSRAMSLYAAVFCSFAILALFQAIKLVDPSALSFGLFSGAASSPIGTWYDFSIFSGAVFIISALAFLYFPMSKAVKWAVGAFFAVSFLALFIASLASIWLGIALVFLAVIFHRYANEKKGLSWMERLPIFAIVVFAVAALMSWQGNAISAPVVNALKIGYGEVHLPWQMTLDVGNGIIKASPILGSGPNTFANEYLLYKPAGVNATQYWNAQFVNGSGLIPTLALSLGLAGIILFSLLYVYFIRDGVKSLKNRPSSQFGPFISYSSFFAGSFLLFMDLAYVPSYANLFLTFVLIGIFLGSRIASGDVRIVNVPFTGNGRPLYAVCANSCAMLAIVLLAVGFVWYGMQATALGYFVKGAAAISVSPITSDAVTKAEADFRKSFALDHLDAYDQALAQTDLVGANLLAQQISAAGQNAKPTQTQLTEIGNLVNEAAGYAKDAVKRDPTNYQNYLSEAQVFSDAALLQVSGAYDSAVGAYANAVRYDPYDPSIYLAVARLAASQSKYTDATSYLGSALQLKNNYTDAVYLLSQIQVAQGNTADAITSVKFATQLTPNDPTAFFELGFLQYSAGQYSDAETSLAKAVALSPNYANAQYFLGLSYAKKGDMSDALEQFQALAKTNPNNADVASVLRNLEAGKTPFANQTPPVSTPEKRASLPVSDTTPPPAVH